MEHLGTKKLYTERLILRPFAESDSACAFKNWMGDSRVTEYLRWQTHQDIEESRAVISNWISGYSKESFYQWAIVLKETNEPIGSISSVGMDEAVGMIHIGYCIGSAFWHKGYTSEAFNEVIRFLFLEVGALRIESQHDPDNKHSGGIMRKCGLVYEGTHRKADISNRGIVDAAVYAILREDYLKDAKA